MTDEKSTDDFNAVRETAEIAEAFDIYSGHVCDGCPGWKPSCCVFEYDPSESLE